MSRTFRGQPVIRWIIIDEQYKDKFQKEINKYMEIYEFVDCQFSSHIDTSNKTTHYVALILLAEKPTVTDEWIPPHYKH